MEISQSALAYLYLYALLLGVGLGAVYDALRITRVFLGVHYSRRTAKRLEQIRLPLLKPRNNRRESRLLGVVVFFEDLLFCILSGVALILLFYGMNNGKIRFPAFFCAAAGFFLYRATLGRVVMLFSEAIAFVIEIAVRYLVFFLLLPIRVAVKWIARRVCCIVELVKGAHRKHLRRRYTESELRRVTESACGMISEEMPKNRTQKRRGRYVGRAKKTVQSHVATSHPDRHSGRGVPGRLRK